MGGELLGDVALGGAEDDVQPVEGAGGGLLDLDGAALPFDDLACAALAGEQVQLTRRSGRCMILRPSFCIFISSLV